MGCDIFSFTKLSGREAYSVEIDPPDGFFGAVDIPETHDGLPIVFFELMPTDGKNMTITAVRIPRYVEDFNFCYFPKNSVVEAVPENPYFVSDGYAVYSKDKSVLILFTARELKHFDVPKGVRIIGNGAFSGVTELKEVIFPDGLEELGSRAFSLCGLTEVTLPKSLNRIGNSAFSMCFELERINLENVAVLGRDAFNQCFKLESIALNCEVIPDRAFKWCKGLRSVSLDNTKYIGKEAFLGTSNVEQVILPWGLREMEGNAFAEGAESIVLPGSIEKINGKLKVSDDIEVFLSENSTLFSDTKRNFEVEPGVLMYVRSPKTFDFIWAVFAFNERIFDYCKKDGFDFAEYDRDLIKADFSVLRYIATQDRLKHPWGLGRETRVEHEKFLNGRAFDYVHSIIDSELGAEYLEDFRYFGGISAGDFLKLIETAAKANKPEITSFLLQKKRELGRFGSEEDF